MLVVFGCLVVLYFAQMSAYDSFVSTVRQRLEQGKLSVRSAALRAGLPIRSVQGILEGHIPSVERAAQVAAALGLEFYIGPPREDDISRAISRVNKDLMGPDRELLDEIRALRKDVLSRLPRLGQDLPGKVLPFARATERTDDEEFESVRRYQAEDLQIAAGTEAVVDREPLAGEIKFRKTWLRSHRLKAKNLMLLDVTGDSMFPTIRDGDAVLIDESCRSPRSGKIYGLRTPDGPLVKRLRKRKDRWWADSDNDAYKPRPIGRRDRTLGLVVWWAHTER